VLTQAQVQGIYECTVTDWAQVGGAPGPIQRVLPPDGSGVLTDFVTGVLGVADAASLPASAPGCPPMERVGEDEGYDLFHGSAVWGPLADSTQYENAILPFSAGMWTYEAAHDTNPTLDVRSGVRPGALLVDQGTEQVTAFPVAWTGSQWSLNDATVVGDASKVHRISGIGFDASSATISAPAGTFTAADVGRVVDSPAAFPGTRVVAVAPDGTSATISPPRARVTGTADATLGAPVVSEATIAATSGASSPFPGTHYLYDVVDRSSPSYRAALELVGFQDDPSGLQSALCAGAHADDIRDGGYLPLEPITSPGGNVGVTCRRSSPV
jgi:hypothetical protein